MYQSPLESYILELRNLLCDVVFESMFESMSEERARVLLYEHRPSANDSKESRGKAFDTMFKALQENIQACFPEGRTMQLVCPVRGVDRDSDDWFRPALERSFPGSEYKEPLMLHIYGTECWGVQFDGQAGENSKFELRDLPLMGVRDASESPPRHRA